MYFRNFATAKLKSLPPRWWNGRHEGLKIPWPVMAVRVRVPLAAQESDNRQTLLFSNISNNSPNRWILNRRSCGYSSVFSNAHTT